MPSFSRFLSALILLFACVQAGAQQLAYVSDEVFIVLHTGPGTNYRWVAKLTPGTGMKILGFSDDEEWAEVETDRGTAGWVNREFLTDQKPAQALLPGLQQQLAKLEERNKQLALSLKETESGRTAVTQAEEEARKELAATAAELAQLTQISGRAVQLDTDNKRLIEDAEALRSEVDMLQADNQRLADKLRSSAFLDGALAVLLGAFIALVAPRLWPKRRSSSSWV